MENQDSSNEDGEKKEKFIVKHNEAWAIKGSKNELPEYIFPTRHDAIEKGLELAKEQDVVLFMDGKPLDSEPATATVVSVYEEHPHYRVEGHPKGWAVYNGSPQPEFVYPDVHDALDKAAELAQRSNGDYRFVS